MAGFAEVAKIQAKSPSEQAGFVYLRIRMSEVPTPAPRRFSFLCCIIGGFLHFLLSFECLGYYEMSLAAAYMESDPFREIFWRVILWILTPLAMTREWVGKDFLRLTLIWSVVVALVAGFFVPAISRGLRRRLESPVDSNTRITQIRRSAATFVLWVLSFGKRYRYAVLLLLLVWFRFNFNDRLGARHLSYRLHDHILFQPIASSIRSSPTFTLYEGLPRQNWKRKEFQQEQETKETFEICRFSFYKRPLPITAEDHLALRKLVTSSSTFYSYGGPKACGGYHPDYALVWTDGSTTCKILICFTCHEIYISDSKRGILSDIRDETFPQLEAILTKYHDQRPVQKTANQETAKE